MVERLFLAVPQGCLQFVIVVFPDHTHLLFLSGFCLYLSLLPYSVNKSNECSFCIHADSSASMLESYAICSKIYY